MTRRPHTPAVMAWTLAAATFAIGFVGCGQQRSATQPIGSPRPLAGTRGSLVGLELMTWQVGDPPIGQTDAGVPELVLAAFADRPLPFSPEVVQAWRQCGLGVVAVPTSEVVTVRERLALAGPVQAMQVPLAPRWMTGVTGTRIEGSQLITLDSGLLRLDRAQPRLLVRSWSVPGEAAKGEPAVRALAQVQVVPQVASVSAAPTRRTPSELLSGTANMPTDEDAGQLLHRLTLDAACDGADAFIIYPLLAATKAEDSSNSPANTADSPPTAPAPAPARTLGPEAPEPPTLGEVLLSDVLAARPQRERTILVIIPHPPREFRLIE
ncbi:MAG TPA: hypothetical protein VHN77_06375 [Phycisphaerales bacterium]|nr:hypothetical protein [Phycisphaerales bacterium]